LKVNRYFGRICCLHLQIQRVSQATNQHEAGSQQSNSLAENLGLYRKREGNARELISSPMRNRKNELETTDGN
jgi:hypothetical protein